MTPRDEKILANIIGYILIMVGCGFLLYFGFIVTVNIMWGFWRLMDAWWGPVIATLVIMAFLVIFAIVMLIVKTIDEDHQRIANKE